VIVPRSYVNGHVAKFPPSIRNNELLTIVWSFKISFLRPRKLR
jgi:hypothetical protein